jgi:hypothetical protein
MNDKYPDDKASQNEYYAVYPTLDFAWIYVAVDIRNLSLCKVGLTTAKSPHKRISQGKTYNPFLRLFSIYELSKCTFGISKKELYDIEQYIHKRSIFGEPLLHLDSNRKSEWFLMDPEEAEMQIDWLFAKRGFAVDGKHLFTYYNDVKTHGDVVIDRMKKIKTIYRPLPDEFLTTAESCNIPLDLYREYYELLVNFHKSESPDKAYL